MLIFDILTSNAMSFVSASLCNFFIFLLHCWELIFNKSGIHYTISISIDIVTDYCDWFNVSKRLSFLVFTEFVTLQLQCSICIFVYFELNIPLCLQSIRLLTCSYKNVYKIWRTTFWQILVFFVRLNISTQYEAPPRFSVTSAELYYWVITVNTRIWTYKSLANMWTGAAAATHDVASYRCFSWRARASACAHKRRHISHW